MRFTNVKLLTNMIGGVAHPHVTVGKEYSVREDGGFISDDGSLRYAHHFSWETDYTKEFEKPMEVPVPKVKLTRKQIVAKSKAFGVQEGGHHYTDMELQPLEATYLRYGLVGLKAAIHTKVDKYITRKKDDELGQLKKAQHCMDILVEITELEND